MRKAKTIKIMIPYCYILISEILKWRKYFLKLLNYKVSINVPVGLQWHCLLLIIAMSYVIVRKSLKATVVVEECRKGTGKVHHKAA